MKKQPPIQIKIAKKITTARKRIYKQCYQRLHFNQNLRKTIVFITGCQRSGTTMLHNCFSEDLRTKTYGETGLAVGGGLRDDPHRLKSMEEIEHIFQKVKAPIIVAKPLVESQNILKLLKHFRGSRSVWVYRHYKDVANSSLINFGTESTKKNLKPIVDDTVEPGWAAEGVTAETKEIIKKYYYDDIPIYDAKILFWYVRNILFFNLKLENNPNVKLCKYEDIVSNPADTMKTIYNFLQVEYPGDKLVSNIHSRSLQLGKQIGLDDEIEKICKKLMDKLDHINAKKRID